MTWSNDKAQKITKKYLIWSADFSWPFLLYSIVLKFLAQYWIMGGNFCFANACLLWSWCFQLSIIHESIAETFHDLLPKNFSASRPWKENTYFQFTQTLLSRRRKKLEQLKNDRQFCNNDHDQEMQSYAKGHGNSSACCSMHFVRQGRQICKTVSPFS